MSESKITRRRFIKIVAGTCALGAMPLLVSVASAAPALRRWNGYVLGAEGSITLAHPEPDKLFSQCLSEIRRLENIFSLYDPQSALCRLNREGRLDRPPAELTELLLAADRYHALTKGAFDVTVQPLWQAYAAAKGNPGPDMLEEALARTGMRHLSVTPEAIKFDRPGMAVTLNGIAQGYITDRITLLLKEAGLRHVLVELGETRAVGGHPAGRPWQIGLRGSNGVFGHQALEDSALATSGGYGTVFGDGANHILDPRTGKSAVLYDSLSVRAPTAVEADALSTGLSLVPQQDIEPIVRQLQAVQVVARLKQGSIQKFGT